MLDDSGSLCIGHAWPEMVLLVVAGCTLKQPGMMEPKPTSVSCCASLVMQSNEPISKFSQTELQVATLLDRARGRKPSVPSGGLRYTLCTARSAGGAPMSAQGLVMGGGSSAGYAITGALMSAPQDDALFAVCDGTRLLLLRYALTERDKSHASANALMDVMARSSVTNMMNSSRRVVGAGGGGAGSVYAVQNGPANGSNVSMASMRSAGSAYALQNGVLVPQMRMQSYSSGTGRFRQAGDRERG